MFAILRNRLYFFAATGFNSNALMKSLTLRTFRHVCGYDLQFRRVNLYLNSQPDICSLLLSKLVREPVFDFVIVSKLSGLVNKNISLFTLETDGE